MRQNHGPPTKSVSSGNLNLLHFAGISAPLNGPSYTTFVAAGGRTTSVLGRALASCA